MPRLSGLSFLRLFHSIPPPHRNPAVDKEGVRIVDDPVQDGIGQGVMLP
jgi:hypothetical protein